MGGFKRARQVPLPRSSRSLMLVALGMVEIVSLYVILGSHGLRTVALGPRAFLAQALTDNWVLWIDPVVLIKLPMGVQITDGLHACPENTAAPASQRSTEYVGART